MSKHAVIHTQYAQVSPDDWELFTYTLEVNESTTIGQIEEWLSMKVGNTPHSFKIVKLESLEP